MSRKIIAQYTNFPTKEVVIEPKKCISCGKSIGKRKLLCERCFVKRGNN